MKQYQLEDMSLKMVVSIPELTHQPPSEEALNSVLNRVSQLRCSLLEIRSMVERSQNLGKFQTSELSNYMLNHQKQHAAILHQKDKQVDSLRKMLEESKRRNMDFLQMIELEFKKKDDLTHQLEQSVKELQQRYDELEERHESKLEQFEQYKQLIERMIKQNDVERNETAGYVAALEKELSALKSQQPRFEDLQAAIVPGLEVIDEVTQTCLTTEKDDDDIEEITKKFKSLDSTCARRPTQQTLVAEQIETRTQEQYDFRKDLEIVLKLSKDRIENCKENSGDPGQAPTNNKKPHTSFIKAFRLSLGNQQAMPITTYKIVEPLVPTISLEFPCAMSLTLLPLSDCDASSSEIERYIGNYQYQGSFDETGCRTGYGVLRKNKKTIYEGDWQNGLFHGWGKLTLSNSKFTDYAGSFERGYFSGRGTLQYTNGDKYIGEVRGNCIEGEGTLYLTNGERIHGVWHRNTLKQRY